MKFLIDAQLPPKLRNWLLDRGHEAVHVADLDLAGAPDSIIAALAERESFYLVSKDEDFLLLRRPDRFGLLWLRIGNATNRALAAWLEPRWPAVEAFLAAGERLIEVR